MELIGRKGRDFFRKRGATVAGEHINMAAKLVFADVAAIAGKAMELYRNEEIDAVYLIYNEFKSVVAQTLLTSQGAADRTAAAGARRWTTSSSSRPASNARRAAAARTWKRNSTARWRNPPPPNTPPA